MKLSILPVVAVLLSSVLAQTTKDNPFKIPEGFSITAGKPTTLEWTPTTPGTVTLRLREGASSALNPGTVIADKIPNDGKTTITLDADTVRNSDYTIEIVSDSDPSKVNYTPQFVVESKNTVVSITSSSESASATSTASSSSSSSKSSSSSSSSASSASSASSSASATSASSASSASSTSSASTKARSSSSSASASASASSASQTSRSSSTSTSASPTVPTSNPSAAHGLMGGQGVWGAVVAVFMAVAAIMAL